MEQEVTEKPTLDMTDVGSLLLFVGVMALAGTFALDSHNGAGLDFRLICATIWSPLFISGCVLYGAGAIKQAVLAQRDRPRDGISDP